MLKKKVRICGTILHFKYSSANFLAFDLFDNVLPVVLAVIVLVAIFSIIAVRLFGWLWGRRILCIMVNWVSFNNRRDVNSHLRVWQVGWQVVQLLDLLQLGLREIPC